MSLYEDPYADPDLEWNARVRQGKYHIMSFKHEVNLTTNEKVWRCGRRGQLYEVPPTADHQPCSPDQVWLCQALYEEGTEIKVMPVRLTRLLVNGEIKLRFFQDERSSRKGHSPWKSYLNEIAYALTGVKVTCVPDRFGRLKPSTGHEFWICKFKLAASLDDVFGGHMILVMELLQEDVEARDKYIAALQAFEAERQAQVKAAIEAAEALCQSQAEAQVRWAEQQKAMEAEAAVKNEFEKQHPELAARLRKLERLERPAVVFERKPRVGGGCGSRY